MPKTTGYLTDLADLLRARGVPVTEEPGWKTRGHGGMSGINGIVAHHTAGGHDASDLRVVRDGRPGLDGPLAQILLKRDGTTHLIAAGRCWHAGPAITGWTNSYTIGIEAVHDGVSTWNPDQYAAYVRLCAALSDIYGKPVKGHKEIATPLGRKTDPNFSMSDFRAAICRVSFTASAPVSAAPARTSAAQLVVDGSWGPATTRALQTYLQSKRCSGLDGRQLTVDGILGRHTWAAMQRWINYVHAHKWSVTGVDLRTHTTWCKSMQRLVHTAQDGSWSPTDTKALQTALNKGDLR